ncbi:hypothetical protein R3P38DRAFT_3231767 [Favolaschia claudopus]|uniref:Uncharacterized protein n=1 Tax=Favolaschia claudopus TaxID=2862362 RepID=A0AAV9ZJW7_9AGAR
MDGTLGLPPVGLVTAPNAQPAPTAAPNAARCPICNKHNLSSPKICKGNYTPANRGRQYQTCPDWSFPTATAVCSGYFWRDDLERKDVATPGTRMPQEHDCGGPNCSQKSIPNRLNKKCVHQFCMSYCKDTSRSCGANAVICKAAHHSHLRSSPISHASSSPAASDLLSFGSAPSSHRPQAEPVTPTPPPRRFAQMLHPDYEKKLQTASFQYPQSPSSELAARAKHIQVLNTYHHGVLVVQGRGPSAEIRPRLSPLSEIPSTGLHRTFASLQTTSDALATYGILADGHWTITDQTQHLSKPNTVLYCRSLGVSECKDFDLLHPAVSSAMPSPLSKRERSSSLITDSDPVTPTKKKSKDVVGAALETNFETPLSSPTPASRGLPSERESSIPISLHDAESTPANRYPLLYTCDMAEGFRQMERLSKTGLAAEPAFCKVFARPFKSSTYSDLHTWEKASIELQNQYVSYGKTTRGLWKQFRRAQRAAKE